VEAGEAVDPVAVVDPADGAEVIDGDGLSTAGSPDESEHPTSSQASISREATTAVDRVFHEPVMDVPFHRRRKS
jgi:hypothetical protein